MRRLLFMLLLLLSWAISAPDLSQLAGVKLMGNVASPMVENHSGRTVFAVTVWLQEADGDGLVHHSYYSQTGIPGGKKRQANQNRHAYFGHPACKGNSLNVVFDDGEFVGADKGNDFEGAKAHLEAERGIKLWKK